MKLTFTLLTFLFLSCNGKTTKDIHNPAADFALYSDYFVFIADDGSDPLVIPTDLNWNSRKDGYDVEFKSWYGTQKDWPIIYAKKIYDKPNQKVPQEGFQNKDIDDFYFNSDKREITLKIPSVPEITVSIPAKDKWVLAPSKNKIHKETYASKTIAEVAGKTRSGWMVYERIRWKEDQVVEFGDFETFYWIPLVIDGDFYHFEQSKDEKVAYKWSNNNGTISVNEIIDFTLEVTQTVADTKSGRKEIPKEVNISSVANDIDITLRSEGSQVGYGKKYSKGLAYYRQSLLVSEEESELSGYGMMELILENN